MKTPAEIQKAYETLKADNQATGYEDARMYGRQETLAWVLENVDWAGGALDPQSKGERQYDDDGFSLE